MDIAGLLDELYGRVPDAAREVVSGLRTPQLTDVPRPGANTIAWLIWHVGRVQDHHVSELIGTKQLWAENESWSQRFGLPPDPHNTGYGHTPEQVAAVRPDNGGALLDYLDAVMGRSRRFLAGLTPEDLDRIVDRRWDPPVTMGVRLVSVADDNLQHIGQAAYLRGLLEG
ncbi:MAG TPA: DinB family protein [Acidimicrobiales bacterium]|nr:DinB family protein [Acidimicrobiales bacterium]